MIARHSYYEEGKTDLRVMQKEAEDRAKGDRRRTPQDTLIHHHAFGELCKDYQHDHFPVTGE